MYLKECYAWLTGLILGMHFVLLSPGAFGGTSTKGRTMPSLWNFRASFFLLIFSSTSVPYHLGASTRTPTGDRLAVMCRARQGAPQTVGSRAGRAQG